MGKPALVHTFLARFLTSLDVPACHCPLWDDDGNISPTCPHVRQITPHSLTLTQWSDLLSVSNPKGFEERPLPPVANQVLTREARIALYQHRHRRGLALFHPDDLCRRGSQRVSLSIQRGRNGSDTEGEVCG
jgi:hypothetical protein